MRDPANTSRQALVAALNSVLSLLDVNNGKLEDRPDRLLFGWDGGNRRDKGRSPKPTEYHETRDEFKACLTKLLKPTHVQVDSYEADDVVATAVKNSEADIVYVVTGDKDLQQLATGRVLYYSLNEKSIVPARVINGKWGVKHPAQMAIALAIIGDKVDAINGINGWGPKRVKKLFESVTAQMTIEEAFLEVERQIPAELRDQFYNDFDLCLLHSTLPGVPPPTVIVPADIKVAEGLQMPSMMQFYRPVHRLYHAREVVDVDGDAEDTPR